MAAPAPSGGPPLTEIASAQADLLFNVFSSLALQGTYTHGVETATVWFLLSPLSLGLCLAGSSFVPGDEEILIRAADLTPITAITAGDTLTATVGGTIRTIIAAQLDPSRQIWTLQGRK
jgi:hypothetical protein